VQLLAFIDDMAARYAWADLAVCRAGALTLAELTAVGLGALLVPFPYAVDDHQTRNAEALVAAGAARLMGEDRHAAQALDPEALAASLEAMLDSRSQLLAMAEAARTLAKPDAAHVIARACVEVGA
jgi:UDP-N-acetylglucosamine--N-acetylmuramyl-(pentapeptide) pyrophosphoryl-undecaprenol N-acetylglucosamine transferase